MEKINTKIQEDEESPCIINDESPVEITESRKIPVIQSSFIKKTFK